MAATEKPVTELTPKTNTSALTGKAIVTYSKSDGSADAFDGDTLKTMLDNFAFKDPDAVPGHLAEFDENGNPVDSGRNLTSIEGDIHDLEDNKLDRLDSGDGGIVIVKENGMVEDSGVPVNKISDIEKEVSVLSATTGISEGIADSTSAGTAQEIVFRKSGGDGVNYIKKFKGKTLAWNQWAKDSISNNYYTFTNGSSIVVVGTPATFNDVVYTITSRPTIIGHKYYVKLSSNVSEGYFRLYNYLSSLSPINTISTNSGGVIVTESAGYALSLGYVGVASGTYSISVILIDLTLMFGAGNEPSTVAEFEAMFPKAYYPYNPGTLISNDADELETVGFNQWDEEAEKGSYDTTTGTKRNESGKIRSKNFNPCFPNMAYYFCWPNKAYNDAVLFFYDCNKNFIGRLAGIVNGTFTTPSNAAYFTWYGVGTTYANDVCINLSDESFNGTYQPYWKRVLDIRLSELTGIPEGGTEADRVTIFPNGLGGAGSAFDSLFVENGVTKARGTMKRVEIPSLIWSLNNGVFISEAVSDFKSASDNYICAKYVAGGYNERPTTEKILYRGGGRFRVIDSTYVTLDAFLAAMDGVYLEYELATPIEYELAEPMLNAILVDELGTEKAVFPTHDDGSPSAPLCTDSNYSISVAKLVSIVKSLSNESNG